MGPGEGSVISTGRQMSFPLRGDDARRTMAPRERDRLPADIQAEKIRRAQEKRERRAKKRRTA